MAMELQSKILRLAAEASLAHPAKGWSEVCSASSLREEIMKAAGRETGFFTDCLEAVGLTRAAVVDAFVLARPSMQRTVRQMEGDGYVPIIPTAPSEQEKAAVPALKTVPCRTEASPPKPAPKPAPEPRPEAAEKPEATGHPEAKPSTAPLSKPLSKASAKPVRKAAPPLATVQGSLF